MDRIGLIMRRRSRAGKVIDLVDFQIERVDDIVGNDVEAIDPLQMGDIAPHAGGKVVEADHLVSGGQKRLAQMGSEETCTTGDKNSLESTRCSGWILCITSRS